jgi:hypothetical protein
MVPINILTVGASEAVVVFVVGLPLLMALEKRYPVRKELYEGAGICHIITTRPLRGKNDTTRQHSISTGVISRL